MRRLPLLVLALLVVLPAADAQARRESTCAKRGSDTVLATKTVRVFSTAPDADVFGCLYGRRPVRLSSFASETTGARQFAVVGDRVAYAVVDCDRYSSMSFGCSAEVKVADLRTRRILTAGFDKIAGVTSLVLSRRGTVAAILPPAAVAGAGPTRLVVMRDGTPEEVDRGDIAATSLALGGRTLFWTNAGQPKSLDLP